MNARVDTVSRETPTAPETPTQPAATGDGDPEDVLEGRGLDGRPPRRKLVR